MLRLSAALLMLSALLSCSDQADLPADKPAGAEPPPAPAPAVPKRGPEAKRGGDDWRAEYARMTSALSLADEEKTNLEAALKNRDAAHARWFAEKGKQLEDLERQMAEAAKARDLGRVTQLTGQARPLRSEIRDLIAAHAAKVRGALAPENQLKWDAHQLAERVLKLTQPLGLSDEQIAAVRAESLTAARAAAKERNPAAAGYLQLERTVETRILTPQQRDDFKAVKKKKPLRSLK